MKIETHKVKLKKENELTVLNTLRCDNNIVLTAMLLNTFWGILKIEITEDEAKQILTELNKILNEKN